MRHAILAAALVVGASGSVQAQPKSAPEPLAPDHAEKMAKGLDLFKRTVRPILEKRCIQCHGGKALESEFDLSDRDGLVKGGLHGKAIEPGKSAASRLMRAIRHQQDPYMPRGGAKLTDAEIAAVAAWIDLGAPYDNPLVAVRKKVSWTDKRVPDEARNFWAFRPLAKPAVPQPKNATWAKTDIDRFVLAKLEANGVAPSPEADARRLVRRAYFDLIGMPPTPEEIDAFVADRSPDAWPKLIDKLLASPHYGERWGRHWLDLARFAESHGFEHDYDRPTAYHYRDFVIDALNRDVPYDKFVQWQIAGDEYEPDNPLALKATGFLAAGVHSTQITKSEAEKHRYDELDDKLNTLGTAMLGLTLGCARCHDHKYDPIPARDYYRMLATFTTTVRGEMELNLDAPGFRKAKEAFDREHAPFAKSVADYEAARLPARFAAWDKETKFVASWETADVKEAKSKEGAKFVAQPDGSHLATGKNGNTDVYTFVVDTALERLAALRLEALADPSMAKGGPGRAGNGNFALSDVRVTAVPRKSPTDKAVSLTLANPRATFEQKGLPVAATIDGDAKSAWAVDPQFGKNHAAVYDVASSPTMPGGMRLTVTLKFNNNQGHQIGRVRLALAASAPPADLLAQGTPASVRTALATAPEKRTDAQRAALHAWYRPLDAEWTKLAAARDAHLRAAPKPALVKALVASEGISAVRLHTQGEDFYPVTYYLRRGDVDNKEGTADQGFLQALMPTDDASKRWIRPAPEGSRTTWRRRALAEWLVDTKDGAGSLLARVMVNRLWQHHLGRGIVATPSDFGDRGDRPSDPGLLEHLASRFVAEGWSLKAMHKAILTSAVYRQGSDADGSRAAKDPDNKWFSRYASRRLSAEAIRDSLLAVSGLLDRKMFGPGTLDEKSDRRSIYFTVKRSRLVPMMVVFDAPEALNGIAQRPTTTIAPQALLLMNNANMRRYAKGLADRVGAVPTPEAAVERVYRLALGRGPDAEERDESLRFLAEQARTYPGADGLTRSVADLCHVVLCLNEFVYVD